MLRAASAKFALTSAPSITSARFQPRPLQRLRQQPWSCASGIVAASITTSSPAPALADSAWRRPSARNFLVRSCAWLRGVGPL